MSPAHSAQRESPDAVDYTYAATKRLLLLASACALLLWHEKYAPWISGTGILLPIIPALVITAFFPKARQQILSGTAVLMLVYFLIRKEIGPDLLHQPTWASHAFDVLRALTWTAVVILGLYALFISIRVPQRQPSLIKRHGVLLLHFVICAMALTTPFWVATVLLPVMAWRLSYLIRSATLGDIAATKFSDHLFYLIPPFGSAFVPTPIGKNWTYLSRHDAQYHPRELARCQLAGLKLLALAAAWEIAGMALDVTFFGDTHNLMYILFGRSSLELPRLSAVLDHNITNAPVAVLSLYLELIYTALRIAAFGHIVVGSIRLFGFHIQRHVDKPLLSTSIIEFWSRWTFYYKEIINDFFFLPAFMALRSVDVRLRLFLAVYAAAFFGNIYFWILWNINKLLGMDWRAIVAQVECVAVYNFLLATGIYVSMVRQQRARKDASPPSPWAAARSIFGVATFYAVIHVWNIRDSSLGPIERLQWFIHLIW